MYVSQSYSCALTHAGRLGQTIEHMFETLEELPEQFPPLNSVPDGPLFRIIGGGLARAIL
ncbi:hypothetical protein Acor_67890 [Acrocarpospora corrugata]|uniref:Uncharacterized protein n=1 Tax=Acrocarpospora corrugata TaxID=35763 RepID=A0A5M3WCC0_9ACTN|nr:hypothetical protein Acor_67890 [Acrocarpospora corrugata]